ncbi:MAG: hypothetical protein WCT31_02000 [Candidatus Micrarchaeia archaeon]
MVETAQKKPELAAESYEARFSAWMDAQRKSLLQTISQFGENRFQESNSRFNKVTRQAFQAEGVTLLERWEERQSALKKLAAGKDLSDNDFKVYEKELKEGLGELLAGMEAYKMKSAATLAFLDTLGRAEAGIERVKDALVKEKNNLVFLGLGKNELKQKRLEIDEALNSLDLQLDDFREYRKLDFSKMFFSIPGKPEIYIDEAFAVGIGKAKYWADSNAQTYADVLMFDVRLPAGKTITPEFVSALTQSLNGERNYLTGYTAAEGKDFLFSSKARAAISGQYKDILTLVSPLADTKAFNKLGEAQERIRKTRIEVFEQLNQEIVAQLGYDIEGPRKLYSYTVMAGAVIGGVISLNPLVGAAIYSGGTAIGAVGDASVGYATGKQKYYDRAAYGFALAGFSALIPYLPTASLFSNLVGVGAGSAFVGQSLYSIGSAAGKGITYGMNSQKWEQLISEVGSLAGLALVGYAARANKLKGVDDSVTYYDKYLNPVVYPRSRSFSFGSFDSFLKSKPKSIRSKEEASGEQTGQGSSGNFEKAIPVSRPKPESGHYSHGRESEKLGLPSQSGKAKSTGGSKPAEVPLDAIEDTVAPPGARKKKDVPIE